jgi:2-polyprenyl-3-methyl-5-hydroxy-6-metoxy-1,4-benzoquinol methylase
MRFPTLVAALDRAWYPGVESHWDDRAFRSLILTHLTPEARVLDVGAGAGIVAAMDLRGHAAHIIGVDPDPRVAANPYLHEAHVGLADAMPFLPSACIDVAVSDNVFEHVEHPEPFLRELHRVVKPGGLLLAKTPNRRHYMPLIARLTPHGFHRFVNRLRGRQEADTFPTRYNLNTPKDLHRWAAATGWEVIHLETLESRPEYLRISALTYPLGFVWERLVNGLGWHALKIVQMSVMRRLP